MQLSITECCSRKYNIPVINLELGPLRSPTYLFTGYFDFSGVNGNTEAEKRYFAAKQQGVVFNKKIAFQRYVIFLLTVETMMTTLNQNMMLV